MTAVYGSSGSFVSRVRQKYIGHSKHTDRRSNFRSKTTPTHGPVHKSDFNYSYSIRHFIWLPKSAAKRLFFCLYQKFSYASKKIDPVINGLSPHELGIHFQICHHSIVKFGIRGLCLGFSKNLMLTVYIGLENKLLIRS